MSTLAFKVEALVDAAKATTYTCTACSRTDLPAAIMYVPPITFVYRTVRETDVDKAYPLNRLDMEPLLECGPCAFDKNRRDARASGGITQMHPLLKTLEIMDRWAVQNVTDLERQRAEARQRERGKEFLESRVHAPSSFVNQTLAQLAKPAEPNKPRPQHRHHVRTHGVPHSPNALKVYGEMRPIVAKQSKKKGKDDKTKKKKR